MILRDFIIVGSGPAGAAAALQLAGKDVLMIDAGFDAPGVASDFRGSLHRLRCTHSDLFPHLIGDRFESLENIFATNKINLKLKSPYMRYIIEGSQGVAPVRSEEFHGAISLAKGGLANGWGGGAYRFTDRDLERFPISYADLNKYYDLLTDHIGISGRNDDLVPWFHFDPNLQEPIKLSSLAKKFLQRYERNRLLFVGHNVYVGMPRLAVLTREHRGRAPYNYDNLEFFKSRNPAIYTPAYTIDRLIAEGYLDYRSGWLVESFEETDEAVKVRAKNLQTAQSRTFSARKLLLGAGALSTARIVLASRKDYKTCLPVLDNPMSCIFLCNFTHVGQELERSSCSLGQLNIICEGEPGIGTIQITLYTTSGPLRSDIIFDLPLPVVAGRALLKHMSPAILLAVCFHPAAMPATGSIRLGADGALEIEGNSTKLEIAEQKLIGLFRKIGYFSHSSLVQYLPFGSSLHVAGMLPMTERPSRYYECDADGRLGGDGNIHVIDGACFSSLPAKNLTFTIMANAMRIAERALRSL